MKRFFSYILIAVLAIFHLFCGTDRMAGGGLDTETSGGRLTGVVINKNGVATTNVQLTLLSKVHTPLSKDTIYTVQTDDHGKYFFKDVKPGMYNLEAVLTSDGTRLLKQDIQILNDSQTTIPPEKLSIPGKIILILDSLSFPGKGILYIAGTSISFNLKDYRDTVKIDSIPAGTIPGILFIDTTGTIKKISDTISVGSEETVPVISFTNWRYSTRLSLNSDYVKNAINGSLYNFPLLVHLDKNSFNFSSAATGGIDLRFTNSQGKPLPYEINHWDSLGTSAAIWVLLDTIKPASSQYITMYWGNKSAKKISNGSSVFDKSFGYRAVLHVEEEKPGVRNQDLYTDATSCKNDGDDFIANHNTSNRSGLIGNGVLFNSSEDDYIIIDSLKNSSIGTGPFTLSMWFKCNSSQSSNLLSWYSISSDTTSLKVILDSTNVINIYYQSDLLLSAPFQNSTNWKQISLTRSQSGLLTLYLDGINSGSVSFTKALGENYSFILLGSDLNSTTGNGTLMTFSGKIDEFRLEATERTAEFIKFDYINQSTTNLIQFTPK